MNKLPFHTLFISFFVLFLVDSNALSQDIIKVKLDINVEQSIQSETISYLSRELRSIKDVTIVEKGADWCLQVVARELYTVGGRKVGIVFSVNALRLFESDQILGIFKALALYDERVVVRELNAKQAELLYSIASTPVPLCKVFSHTVLSGGSEDLQSLCRRIVADFDANQLELVRKLLSEGQELLRKIQQGPKSP